jgi:hypothetical protein
MLHRNEDESSESHCCHLLSDVRGFSTTGVLTCRHPARQHPRPLGHITHKREIVALYLQGYDTPRLARLNSSVVQQYLDLLSLDPRTDTEERADGIDGRAAGLPERPVLCDTI